MTSSDLPTVSVIIPTYRRARILAATVQAVLADPATTECVVCIDGCRDGSLELVQELARQDDRVVPVFCEHGGKNAAILSGLELASSEVVLLLDDDLLAGDGLVSGHARHHLAGQKLVVMGYTPCGEGSRPRSLVFNALYKSMYEASCADLERAPARPHGWSWDDPVLRGLWGGNVSMRRSDLAALGLRVPHFHHEDTDLGLRALRAGYSGIFDRSLLATHDVDYRAQDLVRWAKASGQGHWLLEQEHADLLAGGLWPPAAAWSPRWAVRLIAGRSSALVVRLAAVCGAVAELANGLSWERGASRAVRAARLLAYEGGYAQMRRAPGPPAGP